MQSVGPYKELMCALECVFIRDLLVRLRAFWTPRAALRTERTPHVLWDYGSPLLLYPQSFNLVAGWRPSVYRSGTASRSQIPQGFRAGANSGHSVKGFTQLSVWQRWRELDSLLSCAPFFSLETKEISGLYWKTRGSREIGETKMKNRGETNKWWVVWLC